ncbi:hypothetical protein KBTX_01921 [wastewater metagenome]|uniref:DUF2062 domain-containing protein n=2 Tax=unclassified sequences TaxID=12908 RepID=A0A5B8RCG7_9ZZZZ|nr:MULTISPECIES: DUF2062 domain-containing protein [Arhodomonas]MCS4503307.1 DUF2062 domain-containing protein [Arhodomonas aquaeolei]QEA05598.1 hypothetical protein KBTEX_01921 [uncultured organism]
MPRRFLKRYLPEPHRVTGRRELRWLGRLLEDPFLLHLNRRSVAGGVAVGLFTAFLPIPFQMILAAALAIFFRVNIVLSVALVWVSNPLTMPALFYFTYMVGTWFLGTPVFPAAFEPNLAWFWHELGAIWRPLLLGSVVTGLLVSLAGYGSVHLLWRFYIIAHLRQRRRRRQRRAAGRPRG